MPDTLIGIVLLVFFALPGFVLVQVSRRGRAYAEPHTDLEVVLRGLAWTLVIQLAFGWWSAMIVSDLREEAADRNAQRLRQAVIGGGDAADVAATYSPPLSALDVWDARAAHIVAFAVVVVLIVPTLLGSLIGWRLRDADIRDSGPDWWERLLGAANPPQAWDTMARHLGDGGWVVIKRKGEASLLAGVFGKRSYLSLSPTASRDIHLEQVWYVSAAGDPLAPVTPSRALWIDAEQIEYLHVIPNPPAVGSAVEPTPSEETVNG